MTYETDLSPMALYLQRLHILENAATDAGHSEAYRDALNVALELLRYKRGEAEYAERQLHTRYYCGICYGEIPQGEDVRLYGDRLRRRAHHACEHIYYRNTADVRKAIQSGKPPHEPGKCYSKDKCPLLDGLPVMHPKRDVFQETI